MVDVSPKCHASLLLVVEAASHVPPHEVFSWHRNIHHLLMDLSRVMYRSYTTPFLLFQSNAILIAAKIQEVR